MCKKHTHNCVCEEAVRFTYDNLKQKNYSSVDAIQSASEVLRNHHPEMNEEQISSKIFSILIKS